MKQLPDAFEKFGIAILSEKKEIKINHCYHPWVELCKRTPNFFEIVTTGKNAKDYTNAVFHKLLEVQPTEKTAAKAKENLIKFLRWVDNVAFRVISV